MFSYVYNGGYLGPPSLYLLVLDNFFSPVDPHIYQPIGSHLSGHAAHLFYFCLINNTNLSTLTHRWAHVKPNRLSSIGTWFLRLRAFYVLTLQLVSPPHVNAYWLRLQSPGSRTKSVHPYFSYGSSGYRPGKLYSAYRFCGTL